MKLIQSVFCRQNPDSDKNPLNSMFGVRKIKSESVSYDLEVIRRALATTGALLWGIVPMHVLGWLTSAVARNEAADNALQHEAVYRFLVWWQGGTKPMSLFLLLAGFLVFLIACELIAEKFGYSPSVDGMSGARKILRKLLLPAFLSGAAFATGLLGGANFGSLLHAAAWLAFMSTFVFLSNFVIEMAEIRQTRTSD